jgi:hypothetical protein
VLFVTGITVAVPLLNVYVDAPDGIIVNTWPEQTVPLLTASVGVL